MLHQPVDQFGPRVDGSLRFVVTSFRVRPHDVTGLLERIDQKVEHALAPKTNTGVRQQKSDPGVAFLGTRRYPAERCHSPRLPDQLACLGFVPLKVRIYVHDRRFNNVALRVNIVWSRRERSDDTSVTHEIINENRRLYERLQGFAWNITGIHFARPGEPKHIVLDFHGKNGWLAPRERCELTIDHYGVIRVAQT